ncbi:hypothetical protein [Nocardia sp. NPDC004604]|uniref:hypothetical protein n=1 Tax=Nocardia sp. NPDC004604 TaxID=3157013 RepID=UPI0033B0765C
MNRPSSSCNSRRSAFENGASTAPALRDAALLCQRITERTGALRDAVHAYESEMLDYGFDMVERSLRSVT